MFVRISIRGDLPSLIAIESHCFEEPWTQRDFMVALRKRNALTVVAERDDRILGYLVYEWYSRHFEIINMAVDPNHHLEGAGTAMVRHVLGFLHPQRRTSLIADVTETNVSAQLFFRSLGFRVYKVLRGEQEDVYAMRYHLTPAKYLPENRISSHHFHS